MKPGDVVLIRFPQADLEAGKPHPALVLLLPPVVMQMYCSLSFPHALTRPFPNSTR